MFDFDEAVFQLEDYFDSAAMDDTDMESLVVNIEIILARCGATEDNDDSELVEAISTAAHNSCIDPTFVRNAIGV